MESIFNKTDISDRERLALYNAVLPEGKPVIEKSRAFGKVDTYIINNNGGEWRSVHFDLWLIKLKIAERYLWRGLDIDLVEVRKNKIVLLQKSASFYFDFMRFSSDFELVEVASGVLVLCEHYKYLKSELTLHGKPIQPLMFFVIS